ncbi:MAG: DNA repair protein RecO [Bacteroidales bacterium]|nr:DNA repair protein RecO [Bacteroidales bacterium]
MLYKTRGIILKKIMHADNKMIIHVFTSEYGYKSYMSYFSLRKDKKKLLSLFIPLAVVELLIEQKQATSMGYIKETHLIHTTSPYSFNIEKASISQFLNEALLKILWQCGSDVELYNFIEKALIKFDESSFTPDFHLRFLLHLTDYLGCFPENNYSKENALFNCKKARFEKGNDAKDTELDECLHSLMQQDLFANHWQSVVPAHLRNPLLKTILSYYTEHIVNLSTLKSQEVLHMVLRN